MIIHNVHFWLKQDLSDEDRATIKSELKLLTEISYLAAGYSGPPAPTEDRPVTDHSFDFALSLHFKTLEEHNFYQSDCEAHARFISTCKTFWDRVVIYDMAAG